MEKQGDFYARFQGLCEEKHRSATNVVRSCGLSSCLVTAWRQGASPTLATVMKLARELEVPAMVLLPDDTTSTDL